VCVIGAGPSGTAVLRAFDSAAAKGVDIPEIVCYEKQAEWGGLWNYSWRTGLGADGAAVHNSMYRHLWSNGPKECLEFADYSFEEHFGFPIPSYPPREVLQHYIRGRVEKAGLLRWVRCNTAVLSTTFSAATQKFTVKTTDTISGAEASELFDYVVCCSGHFSTPNVPEFAGMEAFDGRIMHAHDFRAAEEFAGKRVMVVGTSYSAEDIASQCHKYGVKSVHCSWRTAPMGWHWPDNFTTVPLLSHITPGTKTCTFKDGTTAEIDAIILCTGYKHHFPFLAPELRLKTANRLWCDALHEGVVFPDCPRLFYIGMQDQWFTFNMFDAQAWFARDVILGKVPLPRRDQMDAEWAAWRAAEVALKPADEAKIRFQAEYVERLQAMTDYPKFDIEGVVQCFLAWEHNKHTNIMTFRDHQHRSLMTGTLAPVHHTPWLSAFDDSIECYVDGNKPAAVATAAAAVAAVDAAVEVAVEAVQVADASRGGLDAMATREGI
jgi:trimethylamine monooxygenase